MMNLASVWVSLVFGSPEAVFQVAPAIVGLVVSFSSGSSSLGTHGLSGHIQMSRNSQESRCQGLLCSIILHSLVYFDITLFEVGSEKFEVPKGEMDALDVPLTELILSVLEQSLEAGNWGVWASAPPVLFFPLGSK